MESCSLEERLARIRERMDNACARAGRDASDVRMVAVSKTFGPDRVAEAAACGVTIFGENKVQEAAAKKPLCPGHLVWHLVGHLQRNKTARAVRLFDMIHAVDSERLLQTLDASCDGVRVSLPVLLEVNVSGESSKFGIAPEALPQLLETAAGCSRLDVLGLMTIPPWSEEPEKARPYFSALRDLRDRCREQTGWPLEELSMGMSNDFEIAIEEGATWIRVGSALFGDRRNG